MTFILHLYYILKKYIYIIYNIKIYLDISYHHGVKIKLIYLLRRGKISGDCAPKQMPCWQNITASDLLCNGGSPAADGITICSHPSPNYQNFTEISVNLRIQQIFNCHLFSMRRQIDNRVRLFMKTFKISLLVNQFKFVYSGFSRPFAMRRLIHVTKSPQSYSIKVMAFPVKQQLQLNPSWPTTSARIFFPYLRMMKWFTSLLVIWVAKWLMIT